MERKRLIVIVMAIFMIVSVICVHRSVMLISEMFRLNGKLQSEGYYMGEFEFKMLGCAYYLDKGHYITAFSKLNQLHKQLKSKDGLIKIPKFANKKEELEFYITLQDPKTGAFMDSSYPLFTYIGPTLNMVEHLNSLAKDSGQPLRLKYPLSFLDQINTSEKLKAFLDDLNYIGIICSKLPRTPYVEISELCYYSDLERSNLYTFSPEWKQSLLKWLHENQDSKTGFWGPKLRYSGEILNSGDLGTTFNITKLFIDDYGNNLHSEFPLKYKDEMFSTALRKISEPMPADANLSEQHEWSLTRYQGIKLLITYLWKGASPENKNNAKNFIEELVRNRFEKFYIQDQGGFSLYSGSAEATLDGTGSALSLLDCVGVLSRDKQKLLWGSTDNCIIDLGVHQVSTLKESDFASIRNFQEINSIRLYRTEPSSGNYESNVLGIIYPKETPVLDVMDLLPRVTKWVNTTEQNMGNWISKENIMQQLANVNIQSVSVSKAGISLNIINEILQKNGELTVIGFDVLQIPRYKIMFRNK